jgi:hypothetical protein
VAFLDPSAFVGTNPIDKLITSGFHVIRDQSKADSEVTDSRLKTALLGAKRET